MHSTCACALALASLSGAALAASAPRTLAIDDLIARYARINGIPELLVRFVVRKESNYQPAAFHGRYYGLMQITFQTARSMGYHGNPKGLLDPEVNLSYAIPYLATAYRLAGGNEARAVRLYSTGYYYAAKRRKLDGSSRGALSLPTDAAK